MKYLLTLLFTSFCFSVFAQETLLSKQDGIELYYEVSFIRTIKKKKKTLDQYQLIIKAINKSNTDLYATSGSIASLKVANTTSLVGGSASVMGESTDIYTIDSADVYKFPAGATETSTSKFRVTQGVKPTVTGQIESNYKGIEFFQIIVNPELLVGRWQLRDGENTFNLMTDGRKIILQSTVGEQTTWVPVDTNVYQRIIKGQLQTPQPNGINTNGENVIKTETGNGLNKNVTYSSTLTLLSDRKIQYTNSEGMTVILEKM